MDTGNRTPVYAYAGGEGEDIDTSFSYQGPPISGSGAPAYSNLRVSDIIGTSIPGKPFFGVSEETPIRKEKCGQESQ